MVCPSMVSLAGVAHAIHTRWNNAAGCSRSGAIAEQEHAPSASALRCILYTVLGVSSQHQ
eukprot:1520654-Amphidinium_carterae.1